ncbi:MAG: ABC transporter permease [Bacteroidota bacterium]
MKPSPPKYLLRFFRWFCHPDLHPFIEGDLLELYEERVKDMGKKKANIRFAWDVLLLFRPSIIRPLNQSQSVNHTAMFRNYFTIALRTLWQQKGYSALNILGLSLGLVCTFLLVLWIRDEVAYDHFHEHDDQLYRVMRHVYSGDDIETSDRVTWNIAQVLKDQYPEVEEVAIITPARFVMQQDEQSIQEEGIYATPDFFRMFSWDLIQGEEADVIRRPSSLVISRTLAQKYFGDEWKSQALGSTVHDNVYGQGDFTITGVFEDIRFQSSLQFDFVLPMVVYEERNPWLYNWNNSGPRIFVQTQAGTDGAALSAKITDIQNEHIEGFRSDLFLQSYADQHLYSSFKDGKQAGGRIEYVRMFGVVALIILLIASINFVNLATARSMRRAREIGVRKAVGAKKGSLVTQFMGESFLLVFVAFGLAMVLVILALPFFNELTEKQVALASLSGSTFLLFSGIAILMALLAGLYPAFYLSSFDAVRILRGSFRLSGGGTQLRQGLVIFQFAISILLIGGSIIVYQQIDYIHAKNLGLDRENVISMRLEGDMRAKFGTVKEELLRSPGIASVTATSESPLEVGSNTHSVSWRGRDPDAQISMNILMVDFDFLETMKMKLVKGRNFDPKFGTDSFNYIINRRALEVMEFEEPLGEELSFWGATGTIVGVVEDFHMASLYSEISPTIIQLRPKATGQLFLRTQPGRTQEAIARLENIARQFNPSYPFEYDFLDDTFRQTYRSEMVVGKLAGYFTGFALFIACLGLFGLAAYAAERRNKEIGIRKVLGATVTSIVTLLSEDFLKLILIGSVIAIPVAWYVMHQWLQHFAYRIEISWWIFALAGLAALLIAWFTISFQSIKAALANPVDSLRNE